MTLFDAITKVAATNRIKTKEIVNMIKSGVTDTKEGLEKYEKLAIENRACTEFTNNIIDKLSEEDAILLVSAIEAEVEELSGDNEDDKEVES